MSWLGSTIGASTNISMSWNFIEIDRNMQQNECPYIGEIKINSDLYKL